MSVLKVFGEIAWYLICAKEVRFQGPIGYLLTCFLAQIQVSKKQVDLKTWILRLHCSCFENSIAAGFLPLTDAVAIVKEFLTRKLGIKIWIHSCWWFTYNALFSNMQFRCSHVLITCIRETILFDVNFWVIYFIHSEMFNPHDVCLFHESILISLRWWELTHHRSFMFGPLPPKFG